MAQNEGKKFEEDWKKSFAKLNAYYFRIKDSHNLDYEYLHDKG